MKRDLHNGDWKMFRYNINKVDDRNELCKVVDEWLDEIDIPPFFEIEWGEYQTNSKHPRHPNEPIVSIIFKKEYTKTRSDVKEHLIRNIFDGHRNLNPKLGGQEVWNKLPFKELVWTPRSMDFIGLKEVQ